MTSNGYQTSGTLILDILEQAFEEIRTSKKIPILTGKRVPDTTQWSGRVCVEGAGQARKQLFSLSARDAGVCFQHRVLPGLFDREALLPVYGPQAD